MPKYRTHTIAISPMTKETAQEAFTLACKVFVEASVLHSAMGVSTAEYRSYMKSSFDKMWKQ